MQIQFLLTVMIPAFGAAVIEVLVQRPRPDIASLPHILGVGARRSQFSQWTHQFRGCTWGCTIPLMWWRRTFTPQRR
ncbi:hypothetical protein JF66_22360 [Cryobacterium sp. MLB-32]|nr:hypothetical protein JF66_22360 [Cryobacterium sp. MLB-32]